MANKIIDSRSDGESARRILRRDPSPHIFRSIRFRSVEARNRIMCSPMCQYSATAGIAGDWHLVHLGERAVGGAGLVFTEAVHVESRGRITKHCLGLWDDGHMAGLRRIAKFVAAQGAVPGIQLGHAGRKASVGRPWEGTQPVAVEDGGWTVIGPTDKPYADGWPIPTPMSKSMIGESVERFVDAVRRAAECGFKILEVHAAHGYLLHQFLSPLSNTRKDEYGGSFENRARLLLETLRAARDAWPDELPIFIRVSATDWIDGGWTLDETIRLCRLLAAEDLVDLVDCSSGGNDPRQQIPIHPGYQVPFARAVRRTCGIRTGAVGLLNSADLVESVVANGSADIVVLGRALLADPMWPLHAGKALRAQNVAWPVQYERANIF